MANQPADGAKSSPQNAGKNAAVDTTPDDLAQLPPYVRSLLKVEVPVRVTLAATTKRLQRILELSPGSILQFNKACDEPLTLEVGDRPVAVGEAVKVGDKFGLWIKSISLPGERFWVLGKQATPVRAR